jgi:hypothetical protein
LYLIQVMLSLGQQVGLQFVRLDEPSAVTVFRRGVYPLAQFLSFGGNPLQQADAFLLKALADSAQIEAGAHDLSPFADQ